MQSTRDTATKARRLMRRHTIRPRRALAFLLAWLLSCLFCAPAFASSADYDSAHPERLNDADLTCASAIVIEAETGTVVYEKNAGTRMYPASTTKILTVYLGLLMGDLGQRVTTSPTCLQIPDDSSTIPLAPGEEIGFRDLLYATMLRSGNEGANLIAETVSGSMEGFVALMNEYSQILGCTDTHFVNPSGLHNDYHYTTARDMAIIAREAMQDATFRDIARTSTYELPKSNIYRARTLTSTHYDFLNETENISRYYKYGIGIKTGSTSAAGHCFVGAAEKDGVTLISVVFNTDSFRRCWSDTKKLMEYGYTQYVATSVGELYAMNPKVLEVSKAALDDPLVGKLPLKLEKVGTSANDVVITMRDRLEYLSDNFNDLVIIDYTRELVAPIEEGEVMGTLTYYPEKGEAIEYQLIASRSIARRVLDVPTLDDVIFQTENDLNPFPRFTVEVFLFFAVVFGVLFAVLRAVRGLLGLRKNKKLRRKAIKPQNRYIT